MYYNDVYLFWIAMGIMTVLVIVKGVFFPDPYIEEATYDEDKKILTLSYSNDSITKYYRDDKKWRTYPILNDTDRDNELEAIYRYIMVHGNPYPTAHLNAN